MTSVPQTFRATGADEAVSITRLVTHQRIGVDLAFDHQLDGDRLAEAVRLALDAQPVLGTALEASGRHLVWNRLGSLPETGPLDVRSSAEPDPIMDAFQAQEVPDTGPQASALLIRTPSGDRVGLKVSHVLADGQAAKQYAYLVADLYSRLGDDRSYVPEPDARPRPTAVDAWAGLSREQRIHATKAKSWSMPTWIIPGTGSSGHGLTYVSAALAPEEFRAMKTWGKERGATVNDMLLASYFRACVSEFSPPVGVPLSIMCTADHRRFLPSRDVPISNISISGSLDLESAPGEPFESTVRRVKDRMAVWAEQCYGIAPARNAERLSVIGYRPMKWLLTLALTGGKPKGGSGTQSKSYPFFTNIGVLDEERLDFGGERPVRASMYGPSARGASSVAVVSTYRDELTVRMGFCAEDCDPGMVRRVLDGTLRELRQGVASPADSPRERDAALS